MNRHDTDETTVQPAAVAVPPAYVPEADAFAEEPDQDEPVKKKKRRWPIALTTLVLLLAGGYVGAAYAFQGVLPRGLTVSGVPVGGMSEQDAHAALEAGLASELQSPREVTTAASNATEHVNPQEINLAVDLEETFAGLTGFSLHPKKMWAHVSGGSNIDAVLTADATAVATEVDRLADAFAQEPTDASLTINDANVSVQPAEEGLSIVKEESTSVIVDEWLAGDAPIQLPTATVDPAISTDELDTFVADTIDPLLSGPISITIKEVMVELEPSQTGSLLSFTNEGGTPELSVDEDGLETIVHERAGEVLGTSTDAVITISGGAPVITPSENGESLDIDQISSALDAEHGFVSSGVVTNGFNSTAMGGGLSQLSTNTFNIGYRAGMTDVFHQPHSKYFPRYPAGLEATIWGEQVPMIWENNTPYGVMVESWVAGGEVHTRLWSTKYWDVEVWQSERFGYRNPETRVNTAADCVPSGAGGAGFSITVGRNVSLNGELQDEDQYTWTYEPVHAVTCG